jgi:hypothetical protein
VPDCDLRASLTRSFSLVVEEEARTSPLHNGVRAAARGMHVGVCVE